MPRTAGMAENKNEVKKIAVIGAGASGMIAACYAAGKDREVTLFEKQKKPGRKILVTGNGRCNISNRNVSHEFYHGENPRFTNNIFSRFGLEETEDFFRKSGIPFIEEKEGKLFPASLQASSVVKMLLHEMESRGVELTLHRRIDHIVPKKNMFMLQTAGKEHHYFDSVILAAGSCAYPPVGASRIGYELAASLGHRIIEPWPVILPLNVPLKNLHRLQGIKWDVHLQVFLDDKKIDETKGEILFTGYGISGPAALKISRSVNGAVRKERLPEISIDFFPGFTEKELSAYLDSIWHDSNRELAFSLLGVLKERMPEVICEITQIDPRQGTGRLSKKDRNKLIAALKGLRVLPGDPRDFKEAVAASGGVSVDEIDPATMESKLVPGLFITGELLDIDGVSGGFNLQFAWSTGAIAGLAQ